VQNSSAYQTVPQRVIPVWIDNNFGQADLLSIQDALDQWSFALNGYLVFRVESTHFDMQIEPMQAAQDGKAWLILKIARNNRLTKYHDDKQPFGHIALAFTDRIGGNTLYLVRDRLDNDQVRGIMMHEMGHLLGAEHHMGDGILMNPQYNSNNAQCVDYDTLKQVALYQHLEISKLNYCQYLSSDTFIKH
jgi:predicted Zn-dependent protease